MKNIIIFYLSICAIFVFSTEVFGVNNAISCAYTFAQDLAMVCFAYWSRNLLKSAYEMFIFWFFMGYKGWLIALDLIGIFTNKEIYSSDHITALCSGLCIGIAFILTLIIKKL